MLRSNSNGDILTFKYYDASADEIKDISEDYEFVINDLLGTLIAPHELNIGVPDLSCPECVDVGLYGGNMACEAAAFACGTIFGGTEDVDALYEGISLLLSDQLLCKKMGQSAKERAEKLFSADRVNDGVVKEYHRLLQDKKFK